MKANKQALFTALNEVAAAREGFIGKVIAAGYPTLESARPAIMEWVSLKTGCKLVTKGTGRAVFDSSDKTANNNARNSLRDMLLWLQGTSRRAAVAANKAASPAVSRKAAPLTAAQKAAVAALVAAFGGDRKAARNAV